MVYINVNEHRRRRRRKNHVSRLSVREDVKWIVCLWNNRKKYCEREMRWKDLFVYVLYASKINGNLPYHYTIWLYVIKNGSHWFLYLSLRIRSKGEVDKSWWNMQAVSYTEQVSTGILSLWKIVGFFSWILDVEQSKWEIEKKQTHGESIKLELFRMNNTIRDEEKKTCQITTVFSTPNSVHEHNGRNDFGEYGFWRR